MKVVFFYRFRQSKLSFVQKQSIKLVSDSKAAISRALVKFNKSVKYFDANNHS